MAPLMARIVAMFYAQCGHTTCGSDLWLPDMSEGECGAGAVDQGCRVQGSGAGGRRSAVVAGAGQECSLQISSQ